MLALKVTVNSITNLSCEVDCMHRTGVLQQLLLKC